MKNFKKITAFMLIAISTQSMFARENKQQIFIENNYGQDVSVYTLWKLSSPKIGYNLEEEIGINVKNKSEKMIKAPTSRHHLVKISTMPLKNMYGAKASIATGYLGSTGTSIANNVTNPVTSFAIIAAGTAAGIMGARIINSLNHSEINKTKDHTFFVIENNGKKSKMAGQKQIKIKEYKSRKHYEDEIAKTTPAGENTEAAIVENQEMIVENQEVVDMPNL